jgi:hypothetical protein
MVHEDVTDGLKKSPEQPVPHLEIRTVRTRPSDGPRATCVAQMVHDLQADSPPN